MTFPMAGPSLVSGTPGPCTLEARGGHSTQRSMESSGFTLSFYHVWVPLADGLLVVLGIEKSMGLRAGCLGDFKATSLDLPKALAYQCLPGEFSQGLCCEARSQVGSSEEAEITCSWGSGRDAMKTLEPEHKEG